MVKSGFSKIIMNAFAAVPHVLIDQVEDFKPDKLDTASFQLDILVDFYTKRQSNVSHKHVVTESEISGDQLILKVICPCLQKILSVTK